MRERDACHIKASKERAPILSRNGPYSLTHPSCSPPCAYTSALAMLESPSQKLSTASWTETMAIHWMSVANAKDV
jgi:hypothetical protein